MYFLFCLLTSNIGLKVDIYLFIFIGNIIMYFIGLLNNKGIIYNHINNGSRLRGATNAKRGTEIRLHELHASSKIIRGIARITVHARNSVR